MAKVEDTCILINPFGVAPPPNTDIGLGREPKDYELSITNDVFISWLTPRHLSSFHGAEASTTGGYREDDIEKVHNEVDLPYGGI